MVPALYPSSFSLAACPADEAGLHSCTRTPYSPFLKYLFVAVFAFLLVPVQAQNYFANADFEQLNNCTEYHQDCSSEAWFNIRPAVTPLINFKSVPHPAGGKDLLIVQVENVFKPVTNRSFVYTMFCCPLVKGKTYRLSCYVNSGGKGFYGIDFYLRHKEFTSDNFQPDSVQPTIHIPAEAVTNLLGTWNFVQADYIATGDERFFLVGNLSKQTFEFRSYERMNAGGDVFYFIDDISFRPLFPEPLCKEFELNKKKLYAQNLRHTERALVDAEPEIITDTITVPAIFFETDKAILKPAFRKLIDSLAAQLANKNIVSIHIEGHTDNAGTTAHNVVLSKNRAEAVRNYFLRKMTAGKENIFAQGKGEAFPVADNATPAGMAKNRRVEIILAYTNRSE